MHFLHAVGDGKFSLAEFFGDNIPSYAILSHTWGADHEEVSFKDIVEGTGENKSGFAKIKFCGKQAAEDELQYFWVDTCCIDKTSSADLSEAINSMFQWYQNAVKCYVYLSDVSVDDGVCSKGWMSDFKKSRWFTRGWTLQELIAPTSVQFFSKEERLLGDKKSLEGTLHEVTDIAIPALQGTALSLFEVDDRMSWAQNRDTKREEDAAYCLLGIFNIHMPLLYGEGREKAMNRLRKEIENLINDEDAPALTRSYLAERSKQEGQQLKKQQQKLLMNSLRFEQIDARHLTIKKAHVSTCRWLLRSPQYLGWLKPTAVDGNHGFLWIKGKAGTGKSTLMKYALFNARETMKDITIIAFFFNARGANLEKTTIGTYRSLLIQLLERFPTLQHVFDSLHLSTPIISKSHRWSAESLKTLLEQVILNLGGSSVFCFIDALDECEEEQVRDMIAFFERISEQALLANVQFHVCFSSRHYPHVTIRNGVELILEFQEGHDQDISTYLKDKLRIGDGKIAIEIQKLVQEKASGIFMWVVLVVAILNKEYDSGRIHVLRRRLQEIPNDLYQLFRDILTRDSHNKDELILCIQWILFAERPLTLKELYFAVLSGTEPDALSVWVPDETTISTMKRFLLDSSKGLAEITESETSTVQFIHESVKDFLLKGSGLGRIWPELKENWEGRSQERLAQFCFRQMSIDVFSTLKLPKRYTLRNFERYHSQAAKTFPFLKYAVQGILYHADAAAGCGITQEHLMQNFPVTRWIRLYNVSLDNTSRWQKRGTLLYILAEGHRSNLIRCHSPVSRYFQNRNKLYRPPSFTNLTGRSSEGIRAVVIANADENATIELRRDFEFSTQSAVLSCRKEIGNEVVFACLLATSTTTAKVISKNDEDGETLLSWAAMQGHEGMVRQLLALGKVDIESEDRYEGRTPLSWAAYKGHDGVVRQLLAVHKVKVDSRDKRHKRTPLSWAAEGGHEKVVKQLLATQKVDVGFVEPFDQRTPLALAALEGHEGVVKQLLAIKGIDVESKDKFQQTPLALAAQKGNEGVVKQLLVIGGANTESKDKFGQTPLELARTSEHKEVVELLHLHMNCTATPPIPLVKEKNSPFRPPLPWHSVVEEF